MEIETHGQQQIKSKNVRNKVGMRSSVEFFFSEIPNLLRAYIVKLLQCCWENCIFNVHVTQLFYADITCYIFIYDVHT